MAEVALPRQHIKQNLGCPCSCSESAQAGGVNVSASACHVVGRRMHARMTCQAACLFAHCGASDSVVSPSARQNSLLKALASSLDVWHCDSNVPCTYQQAQVHQSVRMQVLATQLVLSSSAH